MIRQQLWCCSRGKLLAFDRGLQSQPLDYVSQCEAAALGCVYDVIEIGDDVVLATDNGLFNTFKNPLKKGKIFLFCVEGFVPDKQYYANIRVRYFHLKVITISVCI